MLPIRDRRERVVGYALSTFPTSEQLDTDAVDTLARLTVGMVGRLSRLAGRTLLVPVTPTLVRDGTLTRVGSSDVVWLLATSALEDATTRRSVDRLVGSGFHFALEGFPEGAPLPPALVGATMVLDALQTPHAMLASRIRLILEAGLRPCVVAVDDRATRHLALDAGADFVTGRLLTRGAAIATDRELEDTVLRAINILGAFSDGRPPDSTFDSLVGDDPHLAASLLRDLSAATYGMRVPRSVSHAMTLLGRDAVLDRVVLLTARLIGDAAHDSELAFSALRRARLCERISGALEGSLHPRACALAGLLSVLEFAIGVPPMMVRERLALPPSLDDVLVHRALPLGELLNVVDAVEFAWWADVRARCARLGVAPQLVASEWLAAWRTARDELGAPRGGHA